MDDRIDAMSAKNLLNLGGLAKVRGKEGNVMINGVPVACGQIVNHHDEIAALPQCIHGDAADVACSACDKYIHEIQCLEE